MQSTRPIFILFIILTFTQTINSDCFCGSSENTNSLFNFDKKSPHLLSNLSNYFEYLLNRFNSFNFEDPDSNIKLKLSRTQSIDFEQKIDNRQLTTLHSINHFFYFDIIITLKKKNKGLILGFKKIGKSDASSNLEEQTIFSRDFDFSEKNLDYKICQFTFTFLDATIEKYLKIKLINQLGKIVIDQETPHMLCSPKKTSFFFFIPKNMIANTLMNNVNPSKNSQFSDSLQETKAQVQDFMQLELEVISLHEDSADLLNKISRLSQHIQKLQFLPSDNSEVIEVEDQYMEKLIDKHSLIAKSVHEKRRKIIEIVKKYEEMSIQNPEEYKLLDPQFLKILEDTEDTYFQLFADLQVFDNIVKHIEEQNDNQFEDFVVKNVQFGNVINFEENLAELKINFQTSEENETNNAKLKGDNFVKSEVRQMLALHRQQLRRRKGFPSSELISDFLLKSEKDAVETAESLDAASFKKSALNSYSEYLVNSDKPVDQSGNVLFIRQTDLDIEKKYDGSIHVEPSTQMSEDEEDGLMHEDMNVKGENVEEKINDLFTSSNEKERERVQPCDRVFDKDPVFAYDKAVRGKNFNLKKVTLVSQLTRAFNSNVKEQIKPKVIFNSKVQKQMGSLNHLNTKIQKKINLMSENILDSDKKIQELEDWIINIVEALETNEELVDLDPHIIIYSDYSVYVNFPGLSNKQSAVMLRDILHREEEPELEIMVEIKDNVEKVYFLLVTHRIVISTQDISGTDQVQLVLDAKDMGKKY